MPAHARQRAAEANRAEPLALPIVPFSLKDCTLLVQPTEAEIAAHAAHAKAYPSPYEFWLHATAADWMLDLLRGYWQHIPVLPERELRQFALACVENLEGLPAEGLKFLDVVRRRIDGAVTLDHLSAVQRSVQPSVTPAGVQGLPRLSPTAAAVLAAWHTADRSPLEAAFWTAEFAALHDAFVEVGRAAGAWEWPGDRGEPWRQSSRTTVFARAHSEVRDAALAAARLRQARLLREMVPYPFGGRARPVS
jgi:hypothetical protein